jgi:urease accessory protein
VLGLDHLAFLVAAGLLAAIYRRGAFIPIAFVAASLAGTGLQSLTWMLPAPESLVSISVLLFGALLVAGPQSVPIVVALASAAGIFHGYAYGQSIVGAGMTPLWVYLLGLALVQTSIGLSIRGVAQRAFRPAPGMGSLTLRWAGFVVCAVGLGHLA